MKNEFRYWDSFFMVFSTFINAANSKGRMRIVGSKGYSVIFYCDGEAGLLSNYNQKVGQ